MQFVVDSSVASTSLLNNPDLTELSKRRADLMISMLGQYDTRYTMSHT